LPLPAGQVGGLTVEQVLKTEQRRDLLHTAGDLALRRPANAESEAEVLLHVHVGIERVVLKDHRDVAVGRLEVSHVHTPDRDRPVRDFLEAGDHSQERRLSAARRADEHHEFAVCHRQRDVVDGPDSARELLRHMFELDRCHAKPAVSSRPALCP
jgi:hypothetical protein